MRTRNRASWLVLANLVSTLAKAATLVVLTNAGDMAVAGQYTLALAVVSPVFLLFNLSLRQIYVSAHEDVAYGEFLALRRASSLVGVAVVVLGAAFLAPSLLVTLAAMSVYKFAEGQVDIRMAGFQRVFDLRSHAYLLMLFNLVSAGTLWLLFVASDNLALSIALSSLLALVVCLVFAKKKHHEGVESQLLPNLQTARSGVAWGFPLSISSFAVSLGTGVPVFFLGYFHSAEAVGVYSAIYNITTATNILYASVSQARLRSFSIMAATEDFASLLRQGRKASLVLSLTGLAGTVLVYFLGVPVFSFIFGYSFEAYLPALMMMGAMICITPFGFILDCQLTALHRFKSQGIIAIVSLVVAVCAAVLAVPPLSVLGATLVPFSVMAFRNLAKYALFRRHIAKSDV